LPQEFDSVYERAYKLVRFLGAVGKISNPAMAVRNLVDPKARETRNRTRGIIRKADKSIFYGDSTVNPLSFDGVLKQVVDGGTSDNLIDCKGKRLRLEEINDGATTIFDNYGVPTHLFVSSQAKNYYAEELMVTKNLVVNLNQIGKNIGINPEQWTVANGSGQVITDVFLRTSDVGSPVKNQAGTFVKRPGQPPSTATSAKAPATPSIGTVTTPADTSSVTVFESGDAGNYDYKITAVNQYGESAAVEETTVTVAANDKVVLPVTSGGGAYAPTGYNVYRKKSTESTYYFIFSAAYSASPQNVEDYNLYRHGCTHAFMIDMDSDQVFAFHQLLPFFSMPLAIIDDSLRWLQKLYGTLIVYNPLKIVVIKNIGATAWS